MQLYYVTFYQIKHTYLAGYELLVSQSISQVNVWITNINQPELVKII